MKLQQNIVRSFVSGFRSGLRVYCSGHGVYESPYCTSPRLTILFFGILLKGTTGTLSWSSFPVVNVLCSLPGAKTAFSGNKGNTLRATALLSLCKRKFYVCFSSQTACHYTMSETPQEFMSPFYRSGDGYPNSQLCTWRFLVQEKNPKSQQILIKFPEFNLRKDGDGDVVRIYSGWDEKTKLLAEFNGDHPPPTKGVATDSSVVYVVFKSDSQARSKGFRGVFLIQSK